MSRFRKMSTPTGRGHVAVTSQKPPKLRFRPGDEFKDPSGQLYELIYCYRTQDAPHEWIFHMEERPGLADDEMAAIIAAMGMGKSTPGIVYEIFRNSTDAFQFFSDIPHNGDSIDVSNKTLLKWTKIEPGAE